MLREHSQRCCQTFAISLLVYVDSRSWSISLTASVITAEELRLGHGVSDRLLVRMLLQDLS